MADKKTKQENTGVKPIVVLWDAESKEGRKYLDSKYYIGFYNAPKEDPKHPDLKIYKKDKDGKAGEEFAVLWVGESKNGNKYLYGSLSNNKEIKIVGFINKETKSENGKTLPKVRIFKSSELEGKAEEKPAAYQPDEEPKQETKKKPKKEEKKKVIPSDDDLPF